MASEFDARESLEALDQDRARLATQLTTPLWYHPVISLLATAAVISPGLPVVAGDTTWLVSVIAGFVILIVVVPLLARSNGITIPLRPVGPATQLLLAAQVATLIVLMLTSGVVSKLELSGWWLVPISGLAFVLMLVLGKAYDRAYRAKLSAKDLPK